MSKLMKYAIAAGAGLVLAGCVSVIPESPPAAARYLLSPIDFEEAGAERVSWSLAIDDPQSTRVYDTAKIALMRAPARIEYYAGGEWADRAPRLFEAALIRSFENSGRILGVGDRTSVPLANFILQTDIRAMQAAYDDGAPPEATIEIFARLTNSRGRIFASRLFRQTAPAARNTEASVVAAFDEAMTALLEDMVAWTFDEATAVNAAQAK